ncbi:MAG: hypothetical protein AUG00_00255 [Candidatus Rokubacteria bacterium 13_1_20CM_2_70_7]|nr:MAG: hypothetical protein AUG00_00255 [Candidatus Rokubacteria bacterium 13_1_20CM_2_70_7]
MIRKVLSVVCTFVLFSAGASALAEQKKDCPQPSASVGTQAKPGAPDKVEGEVVKIDAKRNMVTLRASDGTTHEFQGSRETVKNLKVGDHIEMKLRAAAC